MTVLSDRDIKKAIQEGKILIKDMVDDHIGPSSVDFSSEGFQQKVRNFLSFY